jgi:hypothetical protein
MGTVKKNKMKRGRNLQNVADLTDILRAFGPTRNLLTAASNAYLKEHPRRVRKAKPRSASAFDVIPPVQ